MSSKLSPPPTPIPTKKRGEGKADFTSRQQNPPDTGYFRWFLCTHGLEKRLSKKKCRVAVYWITRPVNETLFTSVPVCSDPELLGNHLSELNNLPAAGEAGGCGHGSYVSVNWKTTSKLSKLRTGTPLFDLSDSQRILQLRKVFFFIRYVYKLQILSLV